MRGIVFFLIFALLLLSGLMGYQLTQNRQARLALCALEHDIQVRHDDSVAYLKDNPLGVVSPKTGAIIITAAQLRQGITNQESTLRALKSHLTCP